MNEFELESHTIDEGEIYYKLVDGEYVPALVSPSEIEKIRSMMGDNLSYDDLSKLPSHNSIVITVFNGSVYVSSVDKNIAFFAAGGAALIDTIIEALREAAQFGIYSNFTKIQPENQQKVDQLLKELNKVLGTDALLWNKSIHDMATIVAEAIITEVAQYANNEHVMESFNQFMMMLKLASQNSVARK